MGLYNYTARDKHGKVTKGTIGAEDRDPNREKELIREKIDSMGYVVLSITPVSKFSIASMNKIRFGSGIKTKDVAIFARQFATMIGAGLSFTKCLSILSEQTSNLYLREIVVGIRRDVDSGVPLSDALSKHPKVFPPIFISMVRAGETGGVLDVVLERVADHFENELTLRGKIKSALTYPMAMGVLVLVIMIAMLVFVVPTFQKMFADMGGQLPLPTQMLVNVSNTVRGPGGLIIVALIVAGTFGFRKWKATEAGGYIWDSIKLRLPIIGPIVSKLALSRFTRTLSTLVAAGVPILVALEIVADTAGNAVIARAVRNARTSIKGGEQINKPLAESKVFPPMVVQMVSVGEETGALDAVLSKVADFYDEEVASTVDGLTSIIEPVMMAVMGGVVGGMVIALYMPMFSMITLVQQQG